MERYPLNLDLPAYVATVLKTLNQNGHNAFVVGGAVRDAILGIPPKDFDVATNARPDEVASYFERTVAVGTKFGVILVIQDSMPVEVATFRTDGVYLDARHPETIQFATAEEDAQRRDFTINGLFWDPKTQTVIDYVNGWEDIQSRTIRTIGRPSQRFQEDALRALRAVRFLSQLSEYNFSLEENLAQGIRRQGHLLIEVSRERITEEIQKILKSPKPSKAFVEMKNTKLFDRVFPDFRRLSAAEFQSLCETVDRLYDAWFELCAKESIYSNSMLWAAFMQFFPPGTKNLKSQNSLNLTRVEIKEIKKIHTLCQEIEQIPNYKLARQKRLLAENFFLPAACLFKALHTSPKKIKLLDTTLQKRAKLKSNGTLNPSPLVSGTDLIELGYSPGPEMGEALYHLRELQLNEIVKTRAEALEHAEDLLHAKVAHERNST